jgi:hypothetical protein
VVAAGRQVGERLPLVRRRVVHREVLRPGRGPAARDVDLPLERRGRRRAAGRRHRAPRRPLTRLRVVRVDVGEGRLERVCPAADHVELAVHHRGGGVVDRCGQRRRRTPAVGHRIVQPQRVGDRRVAAEAAHHRDLAGERRDGHLLDGRRHRSEDLPGARRESLCPLPRAAARRVGRRGDREEIVGRAGCGRLRPQRHRRQEWEQAERAPQGGRLGGTPAHEAPRNPVRATRRSGRRRQSSIPLPKSTSNRRPAPG